jgi:hypothetical protein
MTTAPKNKKNQKVSLVYRSRMPLMIPLFITIFSRGLLFCASFSTGPHAAGAFAGGSHFRGASHLFFFPFWRGSWRGAGHLRDCAMPFMLCANLASFKF